MFGLLAFAIVVGVPALAIAAIARVGTLKRKMDDEAPRLIARIYGLEKRVAQLEQALSSATLPPETQQAPQTPAATPTRCGHSSKPTAISSSGIPTR